MKQEIYQEARKHSKEANLLLEKHKLPPTPINYSIFYLYSNKSIPKLTTQVDLLIRENNINDTTFNVIYEEYISQTAQLDKDILSPLTVSISSILTKLEQQLTSEEKTVDDLQKIDKALSSSLQHNALQQIITYVQNTVNGSVDKHKILSEELTKTNSEINELKNQLNEAKNEAISDTLTGFLNRRGCDIKLANIDIEKSHTSLVIDIDHFKLVNDNFGHQIGDKVIQKVAQSIKSQVSDKDLTVRYGGEEFLVIVVDKTIDESLHIAENIRLAICKLKLKQKHSDNYLPQISVSIGVADTHKEKQWKHVIARADKALYEAKNSGRNCIRTS